VNRFTVTLLSIFAVFRKDTCSVNGANDTKKGHHQTLAGGTSTSHTNGCCGTTTPPGFSRWYFNFTATNGRCGTTTPPGFSRWYFNFTATGFHESDFLIAKLKYHRLKSPVVSLGESMGSLLARKLKYQRLKPGGVSGRIDGVVASYKIEVPPAKARWCHL